MRPRTKRAQGSEERFMNSNVKTAIFWVVLICLVVLLWVVVKAGGNKKEEKLELECEGPKLVMKGMGYIEPS